jgi:3-methyladenine DNA glycosylase AlkD
MAAVNLTARSFQTAFTAIKTPVSMGQIFALAKAFRGMPIDDIEKLLASNQHKIRVGAVSIMDWDARDRKTTPARRKSLFDLYIRRHDRIDNWDLVDRSAPSVVGGYLTDKPRKILDKLARSPSTWERRTAIVSTYHFIRLNQLDDTFRIAEILVNDSEDLVQKAVGGWVREAGKRDPARLLAFLERHAATMPRTMLRYAIEKLPTARREYFMGLKAGSAASERV